ncbi:MAG: class I SAM-dependent methyltransferase [Betaproteobacteria bacterium]|nr:MAG: class I SAM-dependent methyltransferase [Betaproteobacteria bacterium]
MRGTIRADNTLVSSPGLIRRYSDHLLRGVARAMSRTAGIDYRWRSWMERLFYSRCEAVHDLPPIFHYWSNRYLRPKLEAIGASDPDHFFQQHLQRCYDSGTGVRRFVSVGAGTCDLEIRLAQALTASGRDRFTIDCLDFNRSTIGRATEQTRAAGVATCVVPQFCDVNRWEPAAEYDAVLANHSLHHLVALEHLFDGVAKCLAPHGRFIVSDMIGRNGHMRWPEALVIVNEYWEELPASYRYDRQRFCQLDAFVNWDCAKDGFEGIRAQDILPLLVQRFSFEVFLAFANVIDPFIERSFGPNFSVERNWDRDFVDRVHARDEAELAAGRIKPTHMFAVMRNGSSGAVPFVGNVSPAQAIRDPH